MSSEQKLAAEASGEAAEATDANAVALSVLAGEAQDTQTDIEKLSAAIQNFGAAEFDVRAATREFESALDDLQSSIDSNGNSLDITSEKGRANEAALDSIAQAALDLSGSLLITTGSQDQAAGAIQRGRDELIRALGQFGITGQAAEQYADKLGLIPGNVPTAVQLSGTEEAISKAERFREALNRISPTKTVTVSMIQQYGPLKPENFPDSANGNIFNYSRAFANGGFDTGIYAGRAGGIQKFAEPETVWEAFISGKPSQRERNIGIWQESGRRLGVTAEGEGSTRTITIAPVIQAAPGMDENAIIRKTVRAIEGMLK